MYGKKPRNRSTTKGQHSFAQIPNVNHPRSAFNRSCGRKTTFDAGLVIPIFCDEVLPGDTIKMSVSHVIRLATPIKPLMDNLFLDFFWFFVPNRLVWSNWQAFMGERTPDPDSTTDYLVPYVDMYPTLGAVDQSLPDYLGVPIGVPDLRVNALPFRGYNLIFNEWFRDQNLVDGVPVPLDDGPDDTADYRPLRRGKRHDYFTSCLPWPQKGDSVEIGVGGLVPVSTTGVPPEFRDVATETNVKTLSGVNNNLVGLPTTPSWSGAGESVAFDAVTGLQADLSAAQPITINQLRSATAMQRLLEKDARGGTRYTEMLHSHFGVISPDARLQRPEYLGGGTALINMSTVPQTGQTETTAQGNLSAFGLSVGGGGNGFVQSFTEHGFVFGLVSARADLTYQQGLEKMWSRRSRLDFYFPTLAHLGEQAVLNKEIYAQGPITLNPDDDVFGYQERWAEYRYKPSQVTGKMRSQAFTGTTDIWHLAQNFPELPTLGETFIEEDPPVDRVIAVPAEPHFIADFYFSFNHVRCMPTFSVPALTDRF